MSKRPPRSSRRGTTRRSGRPRRTAEPQEPTLLDEVAAALDEGEPPACVETAAAAVVWVIGKANELFHPAGLRVKDVIEHFGAGQGVAQRAGPMLSAVGADPHRQFDGMLLGAPDLLVSRRRREIVELRDRYQQTTE